MSVTSEKLWAKSPDKNSGDGGEGESLLQHSLNVSRDARLICERLPFSPTARGEIASRLIEACALHDVGKAASGFQKSLRESDFRWGRRHETLSTALAYAVNPEFDECALFAILTHHRNIPEGAIASPSEKCLPRNEIPPIFSINNDDGAWKQMLAELVENWNELEILLRRLQEAHGFAWRSLPSASDLFRIGIDKKFLFRDYQKKSIPKENRWRASLLRGLLITSDHLASAIDPETGEHPEILDVPRLLNQTTGDWHR